MKIAIYARVSDVKLKEDGERRQDVNRQIERIKDWMVKQNIPIDNLELYVDDGYSAYSLPKIKGDYDRPAFKKLMRDINSYLIKEVYIESMDRWTRRLIEGLETIEIANKNGTKIISVSQEEINILEPSGWFRCATLLLMIEHQARMQGWQIKSGMQRDKK